MGHFSVFRHLGRAPTLVVRTFYGMLLGAMMFVGSHMAYAQAPASAPPAATNAAPPELDWKVLCADEQANGGTKICQLRLNAQFMNDKNSFAGIGGLLFIRKGSAPNSYEIMVQLPITAQLNVPVYITSPDGTPFIQLPYFSCGNTTTCSAVAVLSPDALKYMQDIKQDLWLSYTNAGTALFLKLSMKNFVEQFALFNK